MKNKRLQNVWISLVALGMTAAVLLSLNFSIGQATTQKPRTLLFNERFGEVAAVPASEVTSKDGITNIRVNAIDGVSEPAIAVNPIDAKNLVVAVNDFRLTGNAARVFYSLDKGNAWDYSLVPMSGISGYTETTDPAIAYDADGTVYFAMVHYQAFGNGDGIFVNRSFDKGHTWMTKAAEVKKNNDALVFEDRPVITADRGNGTSRNTIYVAWVSAESGSNKILVSKSVDKGLTFSQPVVVASGAVNTPDIKTGKNGAVYVAWLDNNNAIYTSTSQNFAISFSAPVKATSFTHAGEKVNNVYVLKQNGTSGIKVKSYPRLAVDAANDNIYISYAARVGQDMSDIFVVRSTGNASAWSTPVRVNDDNTKNDQFSPEIVAIQGHVYVSWQDSRDDAANKTVASYIASYSDGNVAVNSRLSSASFEPSDILLNNYMGDYNGIAASDNDVFAVWTDGRNGLFDVYAGVVPVTTTGVKESPIAAADFKVMQNYPNPFNPSTIITYALPKEGSVSIKLFDMTGKEVTEIFNGFQSAGQHSVEFNTLRSGLKLSSGNYIYKVAFGGQMIARKLTLLK